MNDEGRLREVFASVLGIEAGSLGDGTSVDTVERWDSLHHMRLVIALEDAFGITIPDEDVATMTSWPLVRIVVGEQLARR